MTTKPRGGGMKALVVGLLKKELFLRLPLPVLEDTCKGQCLWRVGWSGPSSGSGPQHPSYRTIAVRRTDRHWKRNRLTKTTNGCWKIKWFIIHTCSDPQFWPVIFLHRPGLTCSRMCWTGRALVGPGWPPDRNPSRETKKILLKGYFQDFFSLKISK